MPYVNCIIVVRVPVERPSLLVVRRLIHDNEKKTQIIHRPPTAALVRETAVCARPVSAWHLLFSSSCRLSYRGGPFHIFCVFAFAIYVIIATIITCNRLITALWSIRATVLKFPSVATARFFLIFCFCFITVRRVRIRLTVLVIYRFQNRIYL